MARQSKDPGEERRRWWAKQSPWVCEFNDLPGLPTHHFANDGRCKFCNVTEQEVEAMSSRREEELDGD